ncbi:YfhD family protein [Paenibacillus sp. HJL G12]|uniref:YfhD family protein n=1 Tax=Paenibacillus dendrobii TaxID=2691084 RepID=A0A7X3IJW3_9BACL|nr:YfhD family protein [Paenibacillus dendrobii]MWV45303.1 YfhD family protein [Paenibacillus dendrobii]
MANRDKKGRIMSKTEKTLKLMSMKNEDVEFSGVLADHDDVEAIRRSEAADERQLRQMDDDSWNIKE